MFALPQMISVPVFGSGLGGIDWLGVAPLAAWMMAILLIPGLLNLLRLSVEDARVALARGLHRSVACLGGRCAEDWHGQHREVSKVV